LPSLQLSNTNPGGTARSWWIELPNVATPTLIRHLFIYLVVSHHSQVPRRGPVTLQSSYRYGVSLTPPPTWNLRVVGNYKVNGTSVGSSWSSNVWQFDPTTIEAVPPRIRIAELERWQSASFAVLSPTSDMTLYAIFKRPMMSSISTALTSNAQHKLIQIDCVLTILLIFIWLTRAEEARSLYTTRLPFRAADGS